MATQKVAITCAITGAVHTPTMSPYLPITPEQIDEQAIEAAEAGASIIHLHARDPETGAPTPSPEVFGRFLSRIKGATDAVINITTGGGKGMSIEDRTAAARRFKPEMCSLNMGSMNFGFYGIEREFAADENILNSTRATDFITPKSEISRLFRDAVLQLSKAHEFARTLVNSGRLSVPARLHTSPLNTADPAGFVGGLAPGASAADAPLQRAEGTGTWFLRELSPGFTVLVPTGEVGDRLAGSLQDCDDGGLSVAVLRVAPQSASKPSGLIDTEGLLYRRYDLRPGTAYLLRPDHHICARWRDATAPAIQAAMTRALAIG